MAFALRVVSLDESLFGDELYTYGIVAGNGPGEVLSQVHDTSITPPFHYLLAWLAVQAGDATVWLRVPSLVLGTATVPLIYLLGRLTFGARAGLLAAAIVALSPFAIFYSDEGRAYATMIFLVVLSTVAVLRATETGGWRWWALYAVAAVLSVYTHYTAVFVLLVQAGWAFWANRGRLGPVAVAQAAIVLLYLPWVPGFLEQNGRDRAIELIESTYAVTVGSALGYPVRMVAGHPFIHLDGLPGTAWVIGLGLLVVAAASVRLVDRARRPPTRLTSAQKLVFGLALATPLGLLAYSGLGTNIYSPRNLSASAPALMILLAALVAGLPRRVAAPAAALVLAVFAAGTLRLLDDAHQRPAYRQVASYIHEHRGPGDEIIDTARSQMVVGSTFPSPVGPYLESGRGVADPAGGPTAWAPAAHGRNVFVIAARLGYFIELPPLGGPGYRYVLREGRAFPGMVGLSVGRYSGEVTGRLGGPTGSRFVDWSLGRHVRVSPTAAQGHIDVVESAGGETTLTGWATTRGGTGIPDWILAFSGSNLVAVSRTTIPRPDIERIYGRAVLPSGFEVTVAARKHVTVYALTGGAATPLTPPEEG